MALIVLDEVCEQCASGPVKPSFAIRLALACLYAVGEGERAIFEDFWNEMRTESYPGSTPTQITYQRCTFTRTHFTKIARSVGVELSLDYIAQMQKARGYRPPHQRGPTSLSGEKAT